MNRYIHGRQGRWPLHWSLVMTVIILLLFAVTTACTDRNKNLGTEKNPVRLSFMPSSEKEVMQKSADIITKSLERSSGYKVRPILAKDYISIIDGLASRKTDVAFLNSLGYLLAKDWGKAKAVLQVIGADGKTEYRSALITNSASGIKKTEDINGRTFAYTNPYSMAGYLMPLLMFTEKKIEPKKTIFAGGYSDVIEKVYNGEVDAGAIYYYERDPYGRIRDAREVLVDKYNDMLDRVVIIDMSGTIPTTPVVFRKDLPEDILTKLTESFKKMGSDPGVIAAAGAMYDATGFEEAREENYDKIREILKRLGKDLKETVPGAVTFYKKHFWDSEPNP